MGSSNNQQSTAIMMGLWKYRRGIVIILGGLGVLLLYVLYTTTESGGDHCLHTHSKSHLVSSYDGGGKLSDENAQLQQIMGDSDNDVKGPIGKDGKMFVIGDSHVTHLNEAITQCLIKHANPDFSTSHQVTLYGIPGATVDVLRNNQKLIYLLKSERPEAVLLHVGGNDADSDLAVDEISGNILKYSIELEAVYGVKKVLIGEQFYRQKPRAMKLKAYGYKILELNKQLKFHDSTHFWSHSKLMQLKEEILGEDGVHLNLYAQQHFYESIRDALSHMLTL